MFASFWYSDVHCISKLPVKDLKPVLSNLKMLFTNSNMQYMTKLSHERIKDFAVWFKKICICNFWKLIPFLWSTWFIWLFCSKTSFEFWGLGPILGNLLQLGTSFQTLYRIGLHSKSIWHPVKYFFYFRKRLKGLTNSFESNVVLASMYKTV